MTGFHYEEEKIKALKRIADGIDTANLIAFQESHSGFPGDADRRREIAKRLGVVTK